MIKNNKDKYPKNADGPFYVENGMCICCGVPEDVAPDLMSHEITPENGYHCYFKKQPSTEQEVQQAIDAVSSSCCGAVNYGGNDPEILKCLAGIEEERLLRVRRFNELQKKQLEKLKNSSYTLSKRRLPK